MKFKCILLNKIREIFYKYIYEIIYNRPMLFITVIKQFEHSAYCYPRAINLLSFPLFNV